MFFDPPRKVGCAATVMSCPSSFGSGIAILQARGGPPGDSMPNGLTSPGDPMVRIRKSVDGAAGPCDLPPDADVGVLSAPSGSWARPSPIENRGLC